jgi:hypothetical protein
VKPTPAFKWLLISLIPLTFTWKLVAPRPLAHETQQRIIRFLTAHKFNVIEETPVKGIPIIRATMGHCTMIVAEVSLDGSTLGMLRHLTTRMDQQFFVFHGTIYRQQPIWLAVTEGHWTKYLRRLGLSERRSAPIMVAATNSCNAERLPWTALSG